MSSDYPENRSAFLGAVLARALPEASPHRIMLAVMAMQKATRAYKTAGVNACNVSMSEAQEEAVERRLLKQAKIAIEAVRVAAAPAEPHHVSLVFGGDPRGPCGRLLIEGQSGDSFAGGYAIY